MKCKDIMQVLERIAPADLAESWDNAGLLLGRSEKNVSRILIALDLTEEVAEQAVRDQVDMVVTHHPLIFHGLKEISDGTPAGRKVLQLAGHDISYYAMHTNYDLAEQGMAEAAARRLGLKEGKLLREEKRKTVDGKEKAYGAGRLGILPEGKTLPDFCAFVKAAFGLKTVRVWGRMPRERMVRRIAVLPGSGEDYLEDALREGADVYLTGDIRHHRGMDAAEQGLVTLDCGHFGLEQIFVEEMERYLNSQLSSNIEVLAAAGRSPFTVI